MTGPWWEYSYKQFSKDEGGETSGAGGDQRNLTTKASVANIATEWRLIGERVSWNLLKRMTCWLKQFTPLFSRICSSQRSQPGGWPKCFYKKMKEWVRTCEAFVTVNAAVSWTSQTTFLMLVRAGDEVQAGRPHPHPEGLLEGTGGSAKNGMVANFAGALRRCKSAAKNVSILLGPMLKKS